MVRTGHQTNSLRCFIFDGETEPVDLVLDGKLQHCVDVALLLVASHVQIAVVRSPVGQPVDQPWVAVEVEDVWSRAFFRRPSSHPWMIGVFWYPPGAGGIQDLTQINPPLTAEGVAAPGPDNEPDHCAGLFNVRKQVLSCLTETHGKRPRTTIDWQSE